MNKHTKISLIVLVTVVLLLALSIPGLAKKGKTSCYMRVLTVDDGGNLHFEYFYTDAVLDAGYDDGVLYNRCTQDDPIPFGQEINEGMSYASFDDYCTFFSAYNPCETGKFTLTADDYAGSRNVHVTDPNTNQRFWSTWWSLEIWDSGNFVGYSEYDPNE